MRRAATPKTPAIIARIRQLAGERKSAAAIGRELGISTWLVTKWAKAENIVLQSRSEAYRKTVSDPAYRARLSASVRAGMANSVTRARVSEAALRREDARRNEGIEFAARSDSALMMVLWFDAEEMTAIRADARRHGKSREQFVHDIVLARPRPRERRAA